MKILKLIVDEIPENCGKCPFMQYIWDYPKCVAITDENKWEIEGNPYDMTYRRSDCPLTVDTVPKPPIYMGVFTNGN